MAARSVAMRRLGILLAALVALAVAAAPVYGRATCPCGAAAADCPCHAGGCDLQTPPTSTCHCPASVALFSTPAAGVRVAPAEHRWLVSSSRRLWGVKTVPPLRPPILA